MKVLVLFWFILLSSCVTKNVHKNSLSNEEPLYIEPKYSIGECYYIVDPENFYKGNKDNALKIVAYDSNYYYYRWWIPDLRTGRLDWAMSDAALDRNILERVTKKLDCPGE